LWKKEYFMKEHCVFATLAAGLLAAGLAAGQTSSAASAVPRLVRFSGTANDARGHSVGGVAGITFALYSEETGGAPLWMETQNVQAGPGGHYTVLLGATKSEGLPADLFTTAQARWVGVAVEGQTEQPRVLLVSAPYALKAGDAETLGGLPASAFLLAGPAVPATAAASGAKPATSPSASPDTACAKITSDGTATANQVAKFTAACAIEPSAIFESGGKVGIGTTTPAATLDVKGATTLRGALTMNAQGAATATAGAKSNPLDLLAASYDSSTDTSIAQHFRWQAEAAGNDTASPSGTLNLLYGQGGATPAETGLAVSSEGLVTFGAGQTFPGAGTITGVTAGAGLTGGGRTGAVSLALTNACGSGQTLQWNGSTWACATLAAGTITGVTAGVGLSGGGSAGSVTLTNTGVLAVAGGTGITSSGGSAPTVSLNTGYTDGRYLQLAGGALSGPLNLPANGLATANNQLVLSGGNVGIDTATPGAPLEVAGNMKISGAGSTLTFPDGSTQSTAAGPPVVAAANPLQVALLRWFPADQSVTIAVGTNPNGIAFDGTDIWVANYSSTTVSKVQASTGQVFGTVTVGVGPSAVAFDGANIWVTNQKSNNVSKVRASDGGCVGTCTFAVGTGPNGIAFDGTNIWVTNEYGNNVTKLLASTGALVNTYNVGGRPQGIAFDGTNIWVANEGDGTVSELSSTGAPLATITVGSGPFGVAFDGTNIWVANYYSNSVTKILAATATVVNTYGVGANPYGVAFDGTNIWVSNSGSGTVSKLLASNGALLGTFTVGSSPYGVAFDGADIWVANWSSGTVSKL
jgi:YVTN family beta-propeller protein